MEIALQGNWEYLRLMVCMTDFFFLSGNILTTACSDWQAGKTLRVWESRIHVWAKVARMYTLFRWRIYYSGIETNMNKFVLIGRNCMKLSPIISFLSHADFTKRRKFGLTKQKQTHTHLPTNTHRNTEQFRNTHKKLLLIQ